MLRDLHLATLIRSAEVYLSTIRSTKDFPQDRTGGYLCLAQAENGKVLLIVHVGDCPDDKAARYMEFAQEKAKRLSLHADHMSSWQSRDEAANQYGGAIRAGKYILSFSGLPQEVDEALVLYVADVMQLPANFEEIVALSENTYFSVP